MIKQVKKYRNQISAAIQIVICSAAVIMAVAKEFKGKKKKKKK